MNLTETEKRLAQSAIDEEFKAQVAAVYRVRCQPPPDSMRSGTEIAVEQRTELLAELGITPLNGAHGNREKEGVK
jgi:hypothetical protein